MTHRQIDGIDAYNFPEELDGHPLLRWMGDDYARFIAVELLARFREQDAGTDMLAMKCEGRPEMTTRVDDGTGSVVAVDVRVPLQILLRDTNNACWRLRGLGEFVSDNRHPTVRVAFEIESSERADS